MKCTYPVTLLLVLLLFAASVGVALAAKKQQKSPPSECEKACGNVLTADQKAKLCANSAGSTGPCVCAVAGKPLHLSADDLLGLCGTATNAAPADCMRLLPTADRKKHGFKLCANATGALQGECFNTLTSSPFRGVHTLDRGKVVAFCGNLEDAGPVACMQAIPEVGLGKDMPASLGLLPTACSQSSLYVYPAGTTRNTTTGKPVTLHETRSLPHRLLDTLAFWKSGNSGPSTSVSGGFTQEWGSKRLAILACLEELKHTFMTSTLKADRFGAQPVLEFCMHSSTRTMMPTAILPEGLFLAERLERVEQTKRHLEPQGYRNYLSECAIRIGHIRTDYTKNGKQVFSAEERLRMCEGIDSPNGPFNCADSVSSLSNKGSDATPLTSTQIVELCSAAGGIDRDTHVQLRADARKEEIRMKKLRSRSAKEVKEAEDAKRRLHQFSFRRLGLGPALCFIESRSIGISVEERIELCKGAESNGPAVCYKKAASSLRLASHSEKLILCLGAESGDPAECAHSAPHYLTMTERIHVCSGAPRDRAMEPTRCLQAIEGPSSMLRDAPKRSIGSFSIHLRTLAESTSRAILLHMCSFDGSKYPLAAAECLKSAPPALSHDNAVRTCTNTSTADLFSRVALCQRLLPHDWTLSDTTTLCSYSDAVVQEDPVQVEANAQAEMEVAAEEGRPVKETVAKTEKKPPTAEENRANTAAVVLCAVDMTGYQTYRSAGQARDGSKSDNAPSASLGSWSRQEASEMCRKERADGSLKKCAVEAHASPSASVANNANFIHPGLITRVCHQALSAATADSTSYSTDYSQVVVKAGRCLSQLASIGSRGSSFAAGVAESICTATDPSFVLTCLDQSSKSNSRKEVEFADVYDCLNQPRLIEKAQFAQMRAQDGAPFATAGLRFSLTFDLVDQYGISFYDGTSLQGTGGNAGVSARNPRAAAQPSPTVGCGADTAESDKFAVRVSINEGNEQGAVLWGSRTNSTACGSIMFSNLVLTQPGPVTIKLVSSLRRSESEGQTAVPRQDNDGSSATVLAVMTLNVRPDPDASKDSGRCLFLFREGVCDSSDALMSAKLTKPSVIDGDSDADGGGSRPRAISHEFGANMRFYYPASPRMYLKFLTCTPTFDHWHISWHAHADGFWVEYKNGIDSIWTGHRLPRDDMSFADILEVPADIVTAAVEQAEEAAKAAKKDLDREKAALAVKKEGKKRASKVSKIIRRAYYRKSLQWHPDRWVGMGIYSMIVQTAFEAVTKAHDSLQRMLETELQSAREKREAAEAEPIAPGAPGGESGEEKEEGKKK